MSDRHQDLSDPELQPPTLDPEPPKTVIDPTILAGAQAFARLAAAAEKLGLRITTDNAEDIVSKLILSNRVLSERVTHVSKALKTYL